MGQEIQIKRVLNLLRTMDFVPTYILQHASSQYNARIYDLRRMGYNIISKKIGGKPGFVLES